MSTNSSKRETFGAGDIIGQDVFIVKNIDEGNIVFPDLANGLKLEKGACIDLCTVASIEQLKKSPSLAFAIRGKMVEVIPADTEEQRKEAVKLLEKATIDQEARAMQVEIDSHISRIEATNSLTMLKTIIDTPQMLANGEKNPRFNQQIVHAAIARLRQLELAWTK